MKLRGREKGTGGGGGTVKYVLRFVLSLQVYISLENKMKSTQGQIKPSAQLIP